MPWSLQTTPRSIWMLLAMIVVVCHAALELEEHLVGWALSLVVAAISGNHDGATSEVKAILDQFGFEVADMGAVEGARAIEPLCILWCIPGFLTTSWTHAFKLLR